MRLPASTAACAKGSTTPYLSSPLCLECAHAPHHARRAPRAAPPLLPPSATQQGGRGRHVVAGGCSCSAAVGRMQPLVGTCDAAGWPRVAKYAHTYILYYSLSKSVLPVTGAVRGFWFYFTLLSALELIPLCPPHTAGCRVAREISKPWITAATGSGCTAASRVRLTRAHSLEVRAWLLSTALG